MSLYLHKMSDLQTKNISRTWNYQIVVFTVDFALNFIESLSSQNTLYNTPCISHTQCFNCHFTGEFGLPGFPIRPNSLRFNGHFPREPWLAGVYWSKDWWRWWWQLDNWSYKSCKAPVKSSPPTNQHPVFYRPDAIPVAQPTVSKH